MGATKTIFKTGFPPFGKPTSQTIKIPNRNKNRSRVQQPGVSGKGMWEYEDPHPSPTGRLSGTGKNQSDPPMRTSSYCIIVFIVMYLLVMHSIRQEEQRNADRRQQDLPHPEERRIQQRRKGRSTFAFLKWVARSIWS
jgi:hypothetical protein